MACKMLAAALAGSCGRPTRWVRPQPTGRRPQPQGWGDISLLTTEMLFKIGCPPYVGQGFGVGPLPRLGVGKTTT